MKNHRICRSKNLRIQGSEGFETLIIQRVEDFQSKDLEIHGPNKFAKHTRIFVPMNFKEQEF